MGEGVAIVGMACEYPDAGSVGQLWENVLSQRQAFRRIPRCRLDLDDYWRQEPGDTDATYCDHAALIAGYAFDRVRFRVSGATYRSTDLSHWLALDVADRALRDAGLEDGTGFARESTAVYVGNTLTSEFARAESLRLRWPFVRRVLQHSIEADGADPSALLSRAEALFKDAFAPLTEDSLAGGLSNTIAGRICNYFDFGGGGYTLDGACSSSLLAVATGCRALWAGEVDLVLAGGVDLSLDPFELVGFARLGALARGPMRVYDRGSSGFLPGEGCGFVVLAREADAHAAGLRLYATIRGTGVSSDGNGGMTRPEARGQALAVRRAYQRAGYTPADAAYLEGHGTGTPVGDAVELEALAACLVGRERSVAIGSIKANIGHTKAAAGVAGVIKAALAIHHRILPPTSGCAEPHALLTRHDSPLRVLREPEPWPEGRCIAGVSSFGFGGINAHLTLEGEPVRSRPAFSARERVLAASAQPEELILLEAPDLAGLRTAVADLARVAGALSRAELTDLSVRQAAATRHAPVRAAVVVADAGALVTALARLESAMAAGAESVIDAEHGVFFGASRGSPRITWLFPGQAAPVRSDPGAYARFDGVKALYARPCDGFVDAEDTALAQPLIVAAELAALFALERYGVRAGAALGHSLGELTALHWAGAFDASMLMALVRARGAAMAAAPPGRMVSVRLDPARAGVLLDGDRNLAIAAYNGATQTLIAGTPDATATFLVRARERGIDAVMLPVRHAFHTDAMSHAAGRFLAVLRQASILTPGAPVLSTVTGDSVAPDEDLRALLSRQLTAPVRFTQALGLALDRTDLFIEVGPGRILSGLVAEARPCIAVDAPGTTLRGLLGAVGAAYALGGTITLAPLVERFHRPFAFDPDAFFTNPCERIARLPVAMPSPPAEASAHPAAAHPTAAEPEMSASILDRIRAQIAALVELPASAIVADSRLMQDLHLNSLSVASIVAKVSAAVGLDTPVAPQELSRATVGELAAALQGLVDSGYVGRTLKDEFRGIDAWVRPFSIGWRALPPVSPAAACPPGDVAAFSCAGPVEADRHARVRTALQQAGRRVAGVHLGASIDAPPIDALLAAARRAAEDAGSAFVLIHDGPSCAGFARTFHLEAGVATLVVHLPAKTLREPVLERVTAELASLDAYREVGFDEDGNAFSPQLTPAAGSTVSSARCLTADDVLLATGGAKGIGAECALAMAAGSGCRTLLVGRSSSADLVVQETLRRFAVRGLAVRYLQTDLLDPEALSGAVGALPGEWAAVSAVLHSAGANAPRLIADLDGAAFRNVYDPKVIGLRNVLDVLAPGRLRLLVTFGSIIARTGMRGEADYALANEWLAHAVAAFAQSHPHCRCLNLEWSVWSGTGMGERLGRIEALVREGIQPITVDRGVELLMHLLAGDARGSIVLSGRLPASPTLGMARTVLPFARFLEKPRVHIPTVELVADCEISLDSDPYVGDHRVDGKPLLPGVLALEAATQAAAALVGQAPGWRFTQVEFAHPILIAEAGLRETIRIAALARLDRAVEVAIRARATHFALDHFRVVVRRSELPAIDAAQPAHVPAAPEPQLDPTQALYRSVLFHGPAFRRVVRYERLAARECVALLRTERRAWFHALHPQQLLLPDPGALDATLHALQACIPGRTLLPIAAEALAVRTDAGDWQDLRLHARERSQDGDTFVFDVVVASTDDRPVLSWTGLRLRAIERERPQPVPVELLGPHLERALPAVVGIQIAVGGAEHRSATDPPTLHRADGKPDAAGSGVALSRTYGGRYTLVVRGAEGIACDLQEVDEGVCLPLVSGADAALREVLERFCNGTTCTRIFSLRECLKKGGAPANVPLLLADERPTHTQALHAGPFRLVSTLAADARVRFVASVALRASE